MNAKRTVKDKLEEYGIQTLARGQVMAMRGKALLRGEAGQGTAEYAILVGVLVVLAIAAIVIFKPQLQHLWDAINSAMDELNK